MADFTNNKNATKDDNEDKKDLMAPFSAIQILPKDSDEEKDGNMPKNAAQAMMVFLQTNINNGENASKCGTCLSNLLKIFEKGPDGNKKVSIGLGCLCWNCGHCGLPANTSEFPADKVDGKMPPFAKCKGCGRNDETNFLQIKQPDGSILPFIEQQMMTEEADAVPSFAPDFTAETAPEGVSKADVASALGKDTPK